VNCNRERRVEATAAHAPRCSNRLVPDTAALAGGDEWQGAPKLLPFHYYMLRRLRAAGETVGRSRGGNVLLFPLLAHALPNDHCKRNDAQNYK
jgi:hypothetical protein